MSNPMMSRLASRTSPQSAAMTRGDLMTKRGTAGKALALLGLCAFSAALSWQQVAAGHTEAMYPALAVGLIGGFIAALVVAFRPGTAPVLAPIYAVLEGLFLGTVSALIERAYPGIPQQAVVLTFSVALIVFLMYRSGVLVATPRFRRTLIAAALGIVAFYALQLGLSLLDLDLGFNVSNGPVAIAIHLVTAGVAALFLVLDFDAIDGAIKSGAPRRMEWYGAFSLMLTLVWLYLELLQLLGEGD